MKPSKRAGFTLLETAIALTILTIVAGGAITVMNTGQGALRQSLSDTAATTKANRALNKIVRRLKAAGGGTVAPPCEAPFGSEALSFQEVIGWNGTAPIWSNDVEIRLEYEPNELPNDLDDDGDGFVDEGRVVLTENLGEPDETTYVLFSGVQEFLQGELPNGGDDNGNGLEDERGLSFETVGDELIIRLTTLHRGSDGVARVRTFETSTAFRN